MNLAVLERMVGQGDLSTDAFKYLVNCRGECEWLDYKESLTLEVDQHLCGFAKDVLAMKNVGGGYILVGVKDKTWDQVGLSAPLPLRYQATQRQGNACDWRNAGRRRRVTYSDVRDGIEAVCANPRTR
jgi:hypothetical protein